MKRLLLLLALILLAPILSSCRVIITNSQPVEVRSDYLVYYYATGNSYAPYLVLVNTHTSTVERLDATITIVCDASQYPSQDVVFYKTNVLIGPTPYDITLPAFSNYPPDLTTCRSTIMSGNRIVPYSYY